MLIVRVTSRCKDVSGFDVIWATDRVGSGRLTGQKPSGRVGSRVKNPDPVPSLEYSVNIYNTASYVYRCVTVRKPTATTGRHLVDGGEEDGMVRQEHRKRIGDDAQLTATLGAVQSDDEVGEESRTKHPDTEVARDLSLLPLGIVRPDVVAWSAIFEQSGHQQQTVGVRRSHRMACTVSTLHTDNTCNSLAYYLR